MSAVHLLPSAISELYAQATVTGKITLADRYGIMAALMDDSISEEELLCIDRLLRAWRKGRVHIVDELSNVIQL